MIPLLRAPRIASLLALAALAAAPAAAQSSIAPAVERAARGLAHVNVLFRAGGEVVRVERAASGIVLDPGGLVLTCDYLVEEIALGEGGAEGEYWLQVLIGGARPCGARTGSPRHPARPSAPPTPRQCPTKLR